MKLTYNHFAGQSVERLAALSDGIFGVGMTLLVLDLAVPGAAGDAGQRVCKRPGCANLVPVAGRGRTRPGVSHLG